MVALDDDLDFDFEGEIVARDALKSRQQESRQNAPNQATKYFHTVVCKHWLRNMCIKGEKCDFLHQYDPDRMPECLQWIRHGHCKDPGCLFKHVKDEMKQDCQRYKLGFCKMGSNCRARHERIPYQGLPEILPDWFLDQILDKSELVPRLDQHSKEQLKEQEKDMQIISMLPQQPSSQQRAPMDRPSNVEQLKLQIEQAQQKIQEMRQRQQEEGLVVPNSSPYPPMRPPMPVPRPPPPCVEEEHLGPCPGLPPPIDATTKFFVIRSPTMRNIQISAFRAIWASTRGNTTMFQRVFKTHDHIIIIFACTEVKQFLGYAKMVSAPDEGLCPGIWGEFSSRLGDNFRVHWIKQCQLPFSETDNIRNPMNDHLPVRKSRDGMELPLPVGQLLTKTLWGKPDNDLLVGTEWEKSERTLYDLKSWSKGTKPEPVAFRSVAPVGTFDNTNKRPIKDKSDQKSQQEAQQQAQLQQQVQMQMANHQAHQQRFRKDQSWPSKPMGGRPPWANDKTWNPSGGAAPSRAPPLALTNMMTPSRPPPPSHHPMRQLTAAPSTENVWKPPTSGGGASSPPQTGALPPSASNLSGFQPPQRPPMDMVAQQPNSPPVAMSFQPPMNGHMGTQDWRPPPAPWLQRSSEEAWKPPTGASPTLPSSEPQQEQSSLPFQQQHPSSPEVSNSMPEINSSAIWRPPGPAPGGLTPSPEVAPPAQAPSWVPEPTSYEAPELNQMPLVVENQVWTPSSMSIPSMDAQPFIPPFIPPSVPFIPPPSSSGGPGSPSSRGRERDSDGNNKKRDRVKKEQVEEDREPPWRVKKEPVEDTTENNKKEKKDKKDKKHGEKEKKDEKKDKKKEKKDEKKDKKRPRSSSRSRSRSRQRSRKRKRSRSRDRRR